MKTTELRTIKLEPSDPANVLCNGYTRTSIGAEGGAHYMPGNSPAEEIAEWVEMTPEEADALILANTPEEEETDELEAE